MSDAAGNSVLTPSTELCQDTHIVAVEVSKTRIDCTPVSNPQEVSIELKGQRSLTATGAAPVVFSPSNDDLNCVTDENGYSCGPCTIIALAFPVHTPMDVYVEWSGPIPLHLWVEGDRGYGDVVRLREVVPSPGETTMKTTILTEWRDFFCRLTSQTSVRIEVLPR